MNKNVTIKITGMHCASCATLIEVFLKEASGVKKADVNYSSESANVSFDSEKINTNNLLKVIKDAGYEASL
ncbi:MAG: cation transporter [Candidatus Gracilibacteria bacterium]|jgi:Cu+-exporting ATPase